MENVAVSNTGETIVIDETGKGAFQVEVKAGTSTFLMDEPVAAGGLGSGPNPYDLLSSAIGACTLMTIRLYVRRKEWPLERVRVKVTHHRDNLQAKDRFVREIELIGPIDDTQRARLLEIAMRCPVHLTMERGAIVETKLAEDVSHAEPTTLCEHARDVVEACDR
jgi:putative redox protein